MHEVKIDHPNITRAFELMGQDERGILRTILWVEADVDMTPFHRGPAGLRRTNAIRQDVWEAARAFARKNAISQIVIQANRRSLTS